MKFGLQRSSRREKKEGQGCSLGLMVLGKASLNSDDSEMARLLEIGAKARKRRLAPMRDAGGEKCESLSMR